MPHAHTDSGRVVNGRYRLGGVLGRGGMSVVHRAWDLELRRLVAVKLYVPGADPAADTRLREEARTLAALSHPVLVPVHDAGVDEDDRPYLVMRLVEGCNLRQRLDAGPLPVPMVRSIGARLAGGLAHVHEHGIVHRDVKPANVLLGAADEPYLADFGISRLMADGTRLTVAGQFVGTAGYLAPEQVLGEDAGGPADVYALGLVLLECLTGQAEYAGTDVEAAVARLHRQPMVPEGVPADLAAVLAAMTARDPAQRPTAAECVAALERHATTAPVTLGLSPILELLTEPAEPTEPGLVSTGTALRSRLDAVAARLREPGPRRRSGFAAAAAGSVLLAGLAWTLTTGPLPAGNPVPTPVVQAPAAEGIGGVVGEASPSPMSSQPAAPVNPAVQPAPAPAAAPAAQNNRPAPRQPEPKKGKKKHG